MEEGEAKWDTHESGWSSKIKWYNMMEGQETEKMDPKEWEKEKEALRRRRWKKVRHVYGKVRDGSGKMMEKEEIWRNVQNTHLSMSYDNCWTFCDYGQHIFCDIDI